MRGFLIVLLALASCASVARAQSKAAPPHAPIEAIRLNSHVSVDGVLDEPVWSGAEPETAFFQYESNQGERGRFRTEVWLAYDDAALYVAARMFDPAPDSIIARLSRRDESVATDRFCVYFDPYHDKRSGYYFLINAAGQLFDGTLSNDGNEDASWDGVWEAKERHDAHGWTAEFRIPFSLMRFQKADSLVWGLNYRRVVARYTEQDMLAYQPRAEAGFVSRFPELRGMHGVRSSHTIELLPYLTSKASYLQHDALDPFHTGSHYEPNGGGDLRMGVGPRMTLNATVNPDFGQVEVDPATLSLSDVETYYEEKRPFFVEGSQIFRFGNEGANSYWNFNWPEPTFFYSRRIGRAPQGGLPDSAQFADIPHGARILGAAKLTGKLTPTVNFGTLHALTGRERADVQWLNGGRATTDVEPLTYYGVMRAQKEFSDRRQGLGFMVNLVDRSFDDPLLLDQLNRRSSVAGVDGWVFLDKDQTWVLSGYSTMSYVEGTPKRVTALESGAQHYFQRPDARGVSLDTSATSLVGGGTRLWLNKQKGKWFSNSAFGFLTPGFEGNDIGFQGYSDVINAHTVLGYNWTEPNRWKKYSNTNLAVYGVEDFSGHVTGLGIMHFAYAQLQNLHEVRWQIGFSPQTTSVRRTRGGPRMLNKPDLYPNLSYNSNPSKSTVLYLNWNADVTPSTGARYMSFSPEVDWRPVTNFQINVGPGLELNRNDAQYVTQYGDAAAIETYGARYVFAHLDQKTLYANIRVSCAFTPSVTLQAFVQPYVSVGRYDGYKSLARPASYDFDPLAPPFNADFDFRSLRGNAVFRWEYMPGSAFYLAWTQERSAYDQQVDGSFSSHVGDFARERPNNILLAKVTYYVRI